MYYVDPSEGYKRIDRDWVGHTPPTFRLVEADILRILHEKLSHCYSMGRLSALFSGSRVSFPKRYVSNNNAQCILRTELELFSIYYSNYFLRILNPHAYLYMRIFDV